MDERSCIYVSDFGADDADDLHQFQHAFQFVDAKPEGAAAGDEFITLNGGDFLAGNAPNHVDSMVQQFPSLALLDVNDVLPHKKRISMRILNEDVQPTLPHIDIVGPAGKLPGEDEEERTVMPMPPLHAAAYCCELCGYQTPTQLLFYAHLKKHYEPHAHAMLHEQPKNQPSPTVGQALVVGLKEHPKHDVNLNSNGLPTGQASVVDDIKILNSSLDLKCLFESPTEVQPLKEITDNEVEFSDSEDMLEGIRNVVDKVFIEDTCDGIDFDLSFNGTLDQMDENAVVAVTPLNDECRPEEIAVAAAQQSSNMLPILHNTRAQFSQHQYNENFAIPPSKINCFQDDSDDNLVPGPLLAEPTSAVAVEKVKKSGPRSTTKTSKGKKPKTTRRYCCIKCQREFNSSNALKYHTKTHTGVRPYQCDICGVAFFALNALKSHQNTHSGLRPFQCEHCSRQFRQWGDLNYHITSIHSGQKSYQCEFCGKAFARKYSLVLHRTVHTNESNYVCDFCNKSFRASSYLQNHRMIHTGEKPYECNICLKKFRVSGDARRHMRVHQLNQNEGAAEITNRKAIKKLTSSAAKKKMPKTAGTL